MLARAHKHHPVGIQPPLRGLNDFSVADSGLRSERYVIFRARFGARGGRVYHQPAQEVAHGEKRRPCGESSVQGARRRGAGGRLLDRRRCRVPRAGSGESADPPGRTRPGRGCRRPKRHRQAVLRHLPQRPAPRPAGCRSRASTSPTSAAAPDVWEKVIRKVRVGMMPPQGAPAARRADRATALVTLADDRARRAAAAHPDPGRALVHRLNRAEYAQRRSRPAGARDRSGGAAAARRLRLRLRQRRRRAGRVAACCSSATSRAAGKVSALAVGDPEIGVGRRDLPRPPGRVAGSARRRACRSAPSAGCWRAPRCRSTAST